MEAGDLVAARTGMADQELPPRGMEADAHDVAEGERSDGVLRFFYQSYVQVGSHEQTHL